MSSPNAEKNNPGSYAAGESYTGDGSRSVGYGGAGGTTSNSKTTSVGAKARKTPGIVTKSTLAEIIASLFGLNAYDAPTSTVPSAVTGTTKVTGYKEKYPQWHDAYVTASKISGVDPSYFDRLAQIESSGNPKAKAKGSSAAGLFQFTSGTAKQYGLKNPYDVNQSAVAVGKLTRDNYNKLSKALGRAPTAGELYGAHQQGAAGFSKLATSDAPAYKSVGTAAVIGNGGKLSMTGKEFAAHVAGYYNKGAGGAKSAGRIGGAATQQDTNNGTEDGFWSMMIGGNPTPAEINNYVQSIKSGEIGVDTTLTGSIGNNALTGSAGTDTLTGNAGTNTLAGGSFGDTFGKLAEGDILGATKSFADGVFGKDGLFGGDFFSTKIRTGIPGIDAAAGGTIGPEYGSAEEAASTGNVIYEYFLRIVVIVLGIVFVGVGLSLFAQPVVNQVRKAF